MTPNTEVNTPNESEKKQKNKLSTEAYKGVRDFFPEDMAVEKAIFSTWRNAVEKYGYEEYAASVLEPAELYRAKSGEEIVNEQTYTFVDRGDREVTLRPEMTPTVARMVAARKRELTFPVRWYSIPNLFRYEQPQRGRVREHWQLNVDIFGVESIAAEIEIVNIAHDITRAYGLKESDFEIRLSNRKLMNRFFTDILGLDTTALHKISKLIDRKAKMPLDVFTSEAKTILAEAWGKTDFISLLESNDPARILDANDPAVIEIVRVIEGLARLGITNVRFDPTLMRGFDYYTGIIFEVFDKNPENRRSVFGGGRYDDLISLFGGDKVTAVGFGAGDVVAENLMETYGVLAGIKSAHKPALLSICVIGNDTVTTDYALSLASLLRSQQISVAVDLSPKKLGDKISSAGKRSIPFIISIGSDEAAQGSITIKKLASREEKSFSTSDFGKISQYILGNEK